jgi:hypothetical protein
MGGEKEDHSSSSQTLYIMSIEQRKYFIYVIQDTIPHTLLPNTPLQTVKSPILCVCFLCFGCGNTLVSTLAVWSSVRQSSGLNLPTATFSLTQWNLESICFVLLWKIGFLVIE